LKDGGRRWVLGSFSFAGFLVLFFVFLGGEGFLGGIVMGDGMVYEGVDLDGECRLWHRV